jgi:arginine deiminase
VNSRLGSGGNGLAYQVMERGDFVVPPLPNLLFTRDSSVWVGDEVAVTSLAMPARHRESTITGAVYTHHPRFAGVEQLYGARLEHLEGGDVLLLAEGVVAVGVGERTTPGGAERLARRVFARGLAHSSGRPCTWTPSARWSTSTRWSCTPRSRTPWWPGP